ncbi:acyltransferase family-domain-containing protein [Podospora didyma]|uniref:Acyltransferase family-domain-containing protein n=1 Tax=Podospora didyma TaxID=330526 RepID=A0AAE0KKE9_9PEZI|nr:acyltransferase family-domain-containing protein [Podospora didyma]
MNGHAASKHIRSYEENMALLEEKSVSDVENGAGRADFDHRFSEPTRLMATTAQSIVSGVRSTHPRTFLRRAGLFLIPSFLSRDPRHSTAGERVGPTAYLDGMRGLAALFVFFCHYSYTCFVIAEGWGYKDTNWYLLKLPFIRLFYQGPPMVTVFFVVSGYALSLKPLKLMRSRNYGSFTTTMASFVFRRGMRLFLPTAISTMMVVIIVRLGLYEWTREFSADKTYMRNVQEHHYARLPTLGAQLEDWVKSMYNFIHIWDWETFGGSTPIDLHLWTIPVEFRCSMFLFLALIGTARLRTAVRFLVVILLMVFTWRSTKWEMLLFFSGMLLAELDIIRGAHGSSGSGAAATTTAPSSGNGSTLPPPSPKPPSPKPARTSRNKALWLGLSVLSLYLMSQPDDGGAETPGWVILTRMIPHFWPQDALYRYWQSVGAVIFVLAVGHSPLTWQRFFNSALIQYLGKISYSMYLMHGPVLHTFGYAIERACWGITGVQTDFQYYAGFALSSIFIVPLVICVSDVFWRGVDAPVVRFAKAVEGWCVVE